MFYMFPRFYPPGFNEQVVNKLQYLMGEAEEVIQSFESGVLKQRHLKHEEQLPLMTRVKEHSYDLLVLKTSENISDVLNGQQIQKFIHFNIVNIMVS